MACILQSALQSRRVLQITDWIHRKQFGWLKLPPPEGDSQLSPVVQSFVEGEPCCLFLPTATLTSRSSLLGIPALGSSLCGKMEPREIVVRGEGAGGGGGNRCQSRYWSAQSGYRPPPSMALKKKFSCLWTLGLYLVASTKIPSITDPNFINNCLDGHNEWRGKVNPPAADMKYMVRKNQGWALKSLTHPKASGW